MNRARVDAIMTAATIVSEIWRPVPYEHLQTERSLTLRCPAGWTLATCLIGRPTGFLTAIRWRAHAVWLHRASPGQSLVIQLAPGDDVRQLRAWRIAHDLSPRERERLIRQVLRRIEPEAERWSRIAFDPASEEIPAGEPAIPISWGSGAR